jgi:predicted metal-dependent enzyme (double-stranded beta helix superfamily)
MLSCLPAIAAALNVPASQAAADPYDAVNAAPASHQVLLENEAVRVLRVTIAAGATEPVHDHRWPSVMYFERAQPLTYISYQLRDGRPVETARVDVPGEALTGAQAAEPEGLHAVRNRGSTPFVALRVEFKDRQRAP